MIFIVFCFKYFLHPFYLSALHFVVKRGAIFFYFLVHFFDKIFCRYIKELYICISNKTNKNKEL